MDGTGHVEIALDRKEKRGGEQNIEQTMRSTPRKARRREREHKREGAHRRGEIGRHGVCLYTDNI